MTIATAVALVVAVVVTGQTVEDRAASARAEARIAALEAVEAGRYAHALPGLQEMTADGNARAMLHLAGLYARGLAVPRDPARAMALYEGAIARGLNDAHLPLARLVEECARASSGREPALAERAVTLYRSAAEAGDPDAMIWLGEALLAGDLVDADPLAGSRWLLRAAEAGSPVARMRVGELHRDGFGFPQDPVLAHAWLNLAAASFPLDEAKRGRAIEGREELARALRRDQLDRALEVVRQLYASAS